jgi:hypothetical protein
VNPGAPRKGRELISHPLGVQQCMVSAHTLHTHTAHQGLFRAHGAPCWRRKRQPHLPSSSGAEAPCPPSLHRGLKGGGDSHMGDSLCVCGGGELVRGAGSDLHVSVRWPIWLPLLGFGTLTCRPLHLDLQVGMHASGCNSHMWCCVMALTCNT